MITFTCHVCEYSTIRKNNFTSHTLSKRHQSAMLASNGCPACLKAFSTPSALVRHQKNNCRAFTPGAASGRDDRVATTNITNNINNTVNNIDRRTVNNLNVVVINANGVDIEGVPISKLIKMHRSRGTHRNILKLMEEKPNDIDELQNEFDRRVKRKSEEIYESHSTRCQPGSDGEANCEHVGGLAIDSDGNPMYRLRHMEMDPLITDLLLENKDKVYVTHEPMIERPSAQNVKPIVMHKSHLFHQTGLIRLVNNSIVKHLIFTEPRRDGDRPYEPWIFRDKYFNHFQILEKMIFDWANRHNRDQSVAAPRRRLNM